MCNVADSYTTSQIPSSREPDSLSSVSKCGFLIVPKLKSPAQCHCSLAAICGGISTVAVNRNTLKQGMSALKISWMLSESGALSRFLFYSAVEFCVSLKKTIG